MDHEIKETMSKLSSHQESIIIGSSCHDIQDNLQQNTISPFIIDHNFDVRIHTFVLENDDETL